MGVRYLELSAFALCTVNLARNLSSYAELSYRRFVSTWSSTHLDDHSAVEREREVQDETKRFMLCT